MGRILSYDGCVKPLAFALCLAGCAHIGKRSDLDAAGAQARTERIGGHWDEAAARLESALAEARRRGRTDAEARLLVELGQVQSERALRRGEDTAPALATFERARVAATGVGDQASVASAIDGIGLVHYWRTLLALRDDWDPVMSDFRAALAIRERLGDPRDLAASHFHIGLVQQLRGETADAAQSFARAAAFAQKANDPIELSYALRHQADLAEKQGDGVKARMLHHRSLDLREQAGNTSGMANAHISLARFETPEGHLTIAVALCDQIGDELTRAEAELAWAQMAHDKAHAERALAAARKTHDVETERAAEKLLAAP
jgi:tetratricopeptide (TPR) repeat protein